MQFSDDYEAAVITDRSDAQSTQKYYSSWSEKYEDDMVRSNYNGNQHVVNSFVELGLDKNVRILDLLAGTGLVAQLLKEHGYTNIDAIDGCEDMLRVSKEKNLYKNYIAAIIGKGKACPVEAETYDAIIGSGCFAPGHLYSDVFPELIRLVKPGGIITWVVRQGYEESSPEYGQFYDDVEKLVAEKQWKFAVPRKEVPEYLLGSSGYVYTMQKL